MPSGKPAVCYVASGPSREPYDVFPFWSQTPDCETDGNMHQNHRALHLSARLSGWRGYSGLAQRTGKAQVKVKG
ncbi:hypothetical protein E2C01_062519 [Portunus trituberculatus]|uniref:Uncharacterized protein n=1 Tax=Portunus trituberculatus TaxID=210409 RepID=A0A5B7HEX0_PORTR|nr:hypothetical protein [Portunus trituberculatus]